MSAKLIVGCISGAGTLGGVVAGSYYLLNKETEKSQETNITPSQQAREENTVTKNTKPLKELMDDGFVALDTTAGQEKDNWKKLVAKYNAEGTSVTKITVDGQITKEERDEAENIKKLQVACTKLLAKVDAISPTDKEIAKNWCNKNSTLITQP